MGKMEFRFSSGNVRTAVTVIITAFLFQACGENKVINNLSELKGGTFAVPTGTIADKLVLSKFPDAKFGYYNSAVDACLAVSSGWADAAAYDEPIMRNIAAQMGGLKVLDSMITVDNYGFAVRLGEVELKEAMDRVLDSIRNSGYYDEMKARWLPEQGKPAPMPDLPLTGTDGVLRFGTSAVTEPFSFVTGGQQIVGFDIELAHLFAQELGMQLEIINMDFGGLIAALNSKKVDMIGACITISAERAKNVLFSKPYYSGGIAALVRK